MTTLGALISRIFCCEIEIFPILTLTFKMKEKLGKSKDVYKCLDFDGNFFERKIREFALTALTTDYRHFTNFSGEITTFQDLTRIFGFERKKLGNRNDRRHFTNFLIFLPAGVWVFEAPKRPPVDAAGCPKAEVPVPKVLVELVAPNVEVCALLPKPPNPVEPPPNVGLAPNILGNF